MVDSSAAVPATQLELDQSQPISSSESLHSGHSPSPAESPASSCQSPSQEDPPSHSSTPDFISEPAPADMPHLKETWSNYAGNLFESGRPIEGQLVGVVLADRFQVQSVIGHGSFGYTFKALDIRNGSAEVALKAAKGCHAYRPTVYTYDSFLQIEYNAYTSLMAADPAPVTGFPTLIAAGIHHFCPDEDDDRPQFSVSFLVMQMLGPNVWHTVNTMRHAHDILSSDADSDIDCDDDDCSQSHPRSSSSTVPSVDWVVKTGKGMLKAVADVHKRGYIHRDVKTENFCLDPAGSNNSVYLIDFGFARFSYGYYSFRCDYTERGASFWGTPNYASLAALKSYPQTPRDDLECLVYCMLEMEMPHLRLPWHGTLTNNAEAKEGWSMAQLERMSKQKREAWQNACSQGLVPDYLIGFFNYITSLGPADVPDYAWLMAQLDSGATGKEPSRSAIRRRLAHWPSPEDTYDRKEYAAYAMSQVAAAASKILLPSSAITAVQPSTEGRVTRQRHKRALDEAATAQELEDQQQQQATCKRVKTLLRLQGSVSGDEEPTSQEAAEAAAVVDGYCTDTDEAATRDDEGCPVFGDAQKQRGRKLVPAWTDIVASQAEE